ncbi:MAG: hypothetical protein GF331_03090 [Chitinivibrionales bacterium]|nr:hypothetical protein [Chitinivibrionales bacterium]
MSCAEWRRRRPCWSMANGSPWKTWLASPRNSCSENGRCQMWKSNSTAVRALYGFVLAVLCAVPTFAEDVAVVIKVKGAVTYRSPGSDAWQAVEAGQVLNAGTEIRTDTDGLAMVKFLADGGMMRLKPQTRLTLATVDEKKRGTSISAGAAFFDIKKRRPDDDPFTVSSPTSVATVKGTSFWVRVGDDRSTVLVCLEGTVGITAVTSGKSRDVDAGMTALTDGDKVTVRKTVSADLPSGEATQELEIQFKDKDGSTKTLRIESVPSR